MGSERTLNDLRGKYSNPDGSQIKVGVLTSGGDAPGMNAAVRSVVRTCIALGAQPYAILDGWAGAVAGTDRIRPLRWGDVSSILNRGGTVIGTARSAEFRERSGMKKAARNLLEKGIYHLIVIGGDGSLSGTEEFRAEWPSMLDDLVAEGVISNELAKAHPTLYIAGIVGSIDNDLVGSDMTVGTDSALHRILSAIDEISSTAASHQRTFVLEVMGRHCGYLPLMAAVAGGCDYVFIPEEPPAPGWEKDMVQALKVGRAAGRRESIIIVAEGAVDTEGEKITAQTVADAVEKYAGQQARITILGHTQRGGTPSAYDRWMPTALGYAAVIEVLKATPKSEPYILGSRKNRIARLPLVKSLEHTRKVKKLTAAHCYEEAVRARGRSFTNMLALNRILSFPPERGECETSGRSAKRVAIMHVGGLAPGMNTAARAAVRIGVDKGFEMLGVQGSFAGLMDSKIVPLAWRDVEGWGFDGGAELGTRRHIPEVDELYAVGRAIENNNLDGLVIVGGMNAYLAVYRMVSEVGRYPAFRIPIVLVPATIDNNLPGSELSIGTDTALNNVVWALDRIKESAAASKRCFVAETMGRYCGYLALMAGLASGAERVYLNELPTSLREIEQDANLMRCSFEQGRRLFLAVRNEEASGLYNLEFLERVFEQEGRGLYDVRASAIGHLQQGGSPTPFDRLLATRLTARAMDEVEAQFEEGRFRAVYVGESEDDAVVFPVERMMDQLDLQHRRPFEQWWTQFVPMVPVVSLEEAACPVPPMPTIGPDNLECFE
ncbi:6-phosphofructokinase [Winkia neuii]|uniref:6-phosphofructokinase n=1 Tax=Winkia neuii TaxID=33007 RepID=UPI00041323FF|nr:6-phosphofructokinase [Winkia neuii]